MKLNPYMLLILLSVMISAVSQILLKKSARIEHESFLKEYLNPYVIAGYGLLVVTTLLNILAYSKGVELKSGAVIESLGLFFVILLSKLVFGESVSTRKLAGVLLIVAGVVVFHL